MSTNITIRLLTHRFPAGGPNVSFLIAQIKVFAPFIFNEILLPAGKAIELGVSAPTVTAAILRNGETVITIADSVDPRPRYMRRSDYIFFAVFRKIAVLRFETFQGVLPHSLQIRQSHKKQNPNKFQ